MDLTTTTNFEDTKCDSLELTIEYEESNLDSLNNISSEDDGSEDE
jgi:hypothetical protein